LPTFARQPGSRTPRRPSTRSRRGAEQEIDFLVKDAGSAAQRFTLVGGSLIDGPFDIEVDRFALVEDPFGNRLVLNDLRYGPLT
jgi:predicted enzyme related to lactoylglutathione lyase